MQIIRKRERIEEKHYDLVFHYVDMSSAGFRFACESNGHVDTTGDREAAINNYNACMSGSVNGRAVVCDGVQEWFKRYTEPAHGRCSCGAIVVLDGFTNTCDKCGVDYNFAGQLLAPREQWGEETGETTADILGIR